MKMYRKNAVPRVLSVLAFRHTFAVERAINSAVRHSVCSGGYTHQLMSWLKSLEFVPMHSQSSDCFYPAAGWRNTTNSGNFNNVSERGLYWSASPFAASGNRNAGYLNFTNGVVNPAANGNRADGFPVRCVKAFITFFLYLIGENSAQI